MNDTTQLPPVPDRLSVNPRSRHFNEEIVKHDIGIKRNDKEVTNVEEHCISEGRSEGWIAVASGKALDRKGNRIAIKRKDKVGPFYR